MMAEEWQPIKVLVVDDHPVVRHGLCTLLAGHPDIEVVDQLDNGREVLSLLADQPVDVILLDIQMKGQSGIDTARHVRRDYPDIKIVVLTTYDDESYLHQALEIGVDAYLLKSVSHESLPGSIRAVMQGDKLLSPSLVSTVVTNYQKLAQEQTQHQSGLDEEELQILAAIAEGASNKEIADQFFWSEATSKRRVGEILEKLGTSNRIQAVAEAVRRGLI